MSDEAAARPGWVHLVGAGPGDPALITVRGAALLGCADFVLHDELVDRDLLTEVSETAIVESVGQLGVDGAAMSRTPDAVAKIVERLVVEARAGRRIVRLVCGDPFLFGAGAPEALGLRVAGVPYEAVPGVSLPQGAAAYAGIPLTYPGLAKSVSFVSAAAHDGRPFDWTRLEGTTGTLCVFIGTQQLKRICRGLMIDAGLPARSPCALVQLSQTSRLPTATATLGDMADGSADGSVTRDTMLVVGETAGLRKRLRWFDVQPLYGKRVLVPRPSHQLAPTARLLRRRGAEPVLFPTIAIEPPPDPELARRAADNLHQYDLVVFTSFNGVQHFWRQLDELGLDARALFVAKVAAIGPATAAELERHGVRADIIADKFVAEQLAAAIIDELGEGDARVLLPRALVAREVLPELLREAGMQVEVVPFYQTKVASKDRLDELLGAMATVDIVMLTSSSTAQKLVELLGDDATTLLSRCTIASIGPITTATAEELGMDVAVTAEQSTTEGLVEALERHFCP